MAYTGHGHHIPGTNHGEGMVAADDSLVKCGGVEICPRCIADVRLNRELTETQNVTRKSNTER